MRATIALLGVALLGGHGVPVTEPEPAPAAASAVTTRAAGVSADTRAFLAAVRGADPVLCALAAAPVANGWGETGAPRPDADAHAALLAWALKPTVHERDLSLLEEGLRGADECVRTMAARLLADADGGVPILLSALEDSDRLVRRAAAEGLGHAEATGAVAPLGRRLADDADAQVRAAAAWALGRIENPSAEAALGQALRDEQPFVRRAAVAALGALELESSIDLLVPMLTDTDARTRAATAHALGELH